MKTRLLLPAILALWPLAASAHPSVQPREARPGAPIRAVISIPHGCDGSATVKLRVIIPEGVISVKPMLKAGWTITTVRGPYAHSYPALHGKTLSEGVKEVIWSGRLPDDMFDEFVFSAFLSDSLPAGQRLHFPTYQGCEKGEARWIEIPDKGQDPHALASPAPGILLRPAAQKTAAAGHKAGALTIEAPWARATPAGAEVAGGYLKITNTGNTADRLIGGTFPISNGVEVHEMGMVNGIMKMRQLEKGLEIPAGKTVELKPGGLHLMLTGLHAPLKPGDTVKGQLRFEKAGAVDVELSVTSIGAKSSGGGHMHHHH